MATAQHFQRMISADSHVMEPLDLWWNALGPKLGERTPRYLDEYQGEKGEFFYSGYQGAPVSSLRENKPDTEAALIEAEERGMEACGYDPGVRVRFQEEAGLEAEVMNPTRLLGIMRNPDAEVVQACSEVYNDWLAEFVSQDNRRLIGVSTIQMNDVDWAVKELERTAKKGLTGTMINCQAPHDCPPYRDPRLRPVLGRRQRCGRDSDPPHSYRKDAGPPHTSFNPEARGVWGESGYVGRDDE